MINKNTKVTIGLIISIITVAIPATVGFSKYIDSHVDIRVIPIKEMLLDMKKDIREIRNILLKGTK